MSDFKKPSGPSIPPPPLLPGAAQRPAPSAGASQRPPPIGGSQRPPANIKDALTEARAISGGGFSRPLSSPAAAIPQGRKTIVIVDDDASMRARLRGALEGIYDILEAKDGMEAAELAAKIQPPAMFVCDIVMPRLDGFTLAKVLRSNPLMKRVPIMFVSSRNSPQDVTQALVLGACHYFPKTTPVGDIVAKIRKILG